MKHLFTLCVLVFVSHIALAQNKLFQLFTDSTALKRENNLLIKDFEAQVKIIKPSINFNGLKTITKDSLYAGYYLPKDNSIYLSTWNVTPKMIKDFCTELTGSKLEGEKLAAMYFFGFFLPHEAAHGLQFNAKIRKDNEYDNEYEANKIAILYWRKKGKERELKICYAIAKNVLSKLKNPIPQGEDEKRYLTANYDEMSQDPYKYGYIMFKQIVDIFEDKSIGDFDTYVRNRLQ